MFLSVAPLARSLGIAPSGLGILTWPSTTPRTVPRPSPSAMLARKVSSRLGPTLPLVPARERVWQEPHLATNACLPATRLTSSAPFTEGAQPATGIASAASRPPAATRVPSGRSRARVGRLAGAKGRAKLMSGRNTIRTGGLLDGSSGRRRGAVSRLGQPLQFAARRRDH